MPGSSESPKKNLVKSASNPPWPDITYSKGSSLFFVGFFVFFKLVYCTVLPHSWQAQLMSVYMKGLQRQHLYFGGELAVAVIPVGDSACALEVSDQFLHWGAIKEGSFYFLFMLLSRLQLSVCLRNIIHRLLWFLTSKIL